MTLLSRLTAATRLIVLLAITTLSACGGGGDGCSGSAGTGSTGSTGNTGGTGSGGTTSSGQPTIQATILIFPTGATPPGFLPAGSNTSAGVSVTAQGSTTPITTATVSVDGTTLSYAASDQLY